MKRLFASAIFLCVSLMGYCQTPFNNSTEGIAVPILQLSSGTGTMAGSGGTIEFYKGGNVHFMGRIYTANMYSSGVNSQGKLILSSYYNAYKDEMTLFNGNVGIGTTNPGSKLEVDQGALSLTSGLSTGTGGSASIVMSSTGNNSNSGYSELQAFYAGIGYTTPLVLERLGGNVGIGTTDTKGYKLAVAGSAGIVAEKVTVKTQANWPDYVFKNSYLLPPLSSVELFIKKYSHLPEVPSAEEVEEKGLDLAETQKIMLKKIEELTLYMIKQNNELKDQQKVIEKQNQKINILQRQHLKLNDNGNN